MRRPKGHFFIAGLLAGTASPALAQAVAENAVTQSSDAFGRSVGSESTGLYDSGGIRGFNPVDAGNARLDSLYFDQVSNVSFRLTHGTTIRVGFSTQGYPFPAPTGLVDYALAEVGSDTRLTLDVNGHLDAYEPHLAAELRVPIEGDRLGVYVGGAALDFRRGDGRDAQSDMFGGVVTWKPYDGAKISAFRWQTFGHGEPARPTFFVAGSALPPEIERGESLAQPWALASTRALQYGVVGHLPVAGMVLEAGAFSDSLRTRARYADLFTGVSADGSVADRAVIADAGAYDRSRSGEVRLVKRFTTGAIDSRITLSVRGRMRDRLFGGAQRLSLGPSTMLVRDVREKPAFAIGPKNEDSVRQIFFGAAYSGYFFHRLLIDAGLSKTRYRKTIDFADPSIAPVQTSDGPLLWNASAVLDLTDRLSLMAGMSHGMEEALVAPDRATNRYEAPPAIRTRQEEAGLRYTAGKQFSAVVSAFRIAKPYYNLDPALQYRMLGTVVSQGIEASVVMNPQPGLTILAGAIFADPHIIGEAVAAGIVGPQPIGQPKRRMVANVDWRPDEGRSPLSLDASLERGTGRVGNAANTLALPAKSVLDLGFRYRFPLGPAKVLLRGKLENVLNDYAWDVAPTGGLTYSDPRRINLQLIADF